MLRTERVNGFWDAVRHVFRAEGLKGLWKGAGTTLYVERLSALISFDLHPFLHSD